MLQKYFLLDKQNDEFAFTLDDNIITLRKNHFDIDETEFSNILDDLVSIDCHSQALNLIDKCPKYSDSLLAKKSFILYEIGAFHMCLMASRKCIFKPVDLLCNQYLDVLCLIRLNKFERAWAVLVNRYRQELSVESLVRLGDFMFRFSLPKSVRSYWLDIINKSACDQATCLHFSVWDQFLDLKDQSSNQISLLSSYLWDFPTSQNCFLVLLEIIGPNFLESPLCNRYFRSIKHDQLINTINILQQNNITNLARHLSQNLPKLDSTICNSANLSLLLADICSYHENRENCESYLINTLKNAPFSLKTFTAVFQRLSTLFPDADCNQLLIDAFLDKKIGLTGSLYIYHNAKNLPIGDYLKTQDSILKSICSLLPSISRAKEVYLSFLRENCRWSDCINLISTYDNFVFNDALYLEIAQIFIETYKPSSSLCYLSKIKYTGFARIFLECHAVSMQLLNHTQKAEQCIHACHRIYGPTSDSLNQLSLVQLEQGKFWSSIKSLRKALKYNPNNSVVHYNLSQVHSYTPKSRHILELNELSMQKNLSKADMVNLLYAQAKSNDDCNHFANALNLYLKAGKVKIQLLNDLNLENHLQFIHRQHNFAREFVSSVKLPYSKPDTNPPILFICGLPRSGSSILERVCSCVEGSFSLGESKFFKSALERAKIKFSYDNTSLEISDHQINRLRTNYYSKALENISNPTLLIDKMLYNYVYIPLIIHAFPDSKIILLKRHPLDVCVSLLKCNFSEGNYWSYDFDSIVDFFDEFSRIVDLYADLYVDNINIVHYESLVSSPETSFEDLFEGLDLPWSSDYLYPSSSKDKIIRTASSVTARNPINSRSVGKWRNYQEELKYVSSRLSSLGYHI